MSTRFRIAFFSFVFCCTGVGNAIIGATLPAMLHQWHLSDSRGGLLLLATWGGSTLGAVFAQGKTGRGAATGLAFSAAGLFLMVSGSATLLPILYAVYGLGLGITMTSISLMRAREVEPARTEVELNRLNLLWAFGAFCTPVLALHSLRLLSVASIFGGFGALLASASLVAFALAVPRLRPPISASATDSTDPQLAWAPARLCLFAATAVGLESAIGSWLTTYAERSTTGVTAAVSANAAFWAGLLLSRALHSLSGSKRFSSGLMRTVYLGAVGLAMLLFIALPWRQVLPFAGLLCGLGLGPLYPWVLSVALPRFRSTAVFVFAGIGASVTPWLTGILSSASGSLRIGLLAPAATFVVLVVVAVRVRADVA